MKIAFNEWHLDLASTPSERENWTWIWLAEMPVFAPLVERDDVRALLARVDSTQSAGRSEGVSAR